MSDEFDEIINNNIEILDIAALAEGLSIVSEAQMHLSYILSHQIDSGKIEFTDSFKLLFSEYVQIADVILGTILDCKCEECLKEDDLENGE